MVSESIFGVSTGALVGANLRHADLSFTLLNGADLTNPDVIVVRDASQKPTITCDSRGQKINAVKNGKVYVSLWSVFCGRARSADGALIVPEAAKRLPELVPDTDMNHTIREFYKGILQGVL